MSFFDFLKVQRQGLQSMASLGVIGMHMVSGPIVGVTIGYFLDKWLETGPWLKFVFLFIGICAGFLNVYVDTKIAMQQMEKDRLLSNPANSPDSTPESSPAGATASADSADKESAPQQPDRSDNG